MIREVPTFEEVNDAIDRLLLSPKYTKFREVVLKLLEKAIEKIGRFIGKVLKNYSHSEEKSNASIVFFVAAIIVLIVITIFVIYFIRRRKKRRIKSILGEEITKSTTVVQLQEKSKIFEQEGAYRDAVRLRYVAVLFYLHQNHILYYEQSMTGEEMVRKLRLDNFKAVNSFEKITNSFNWLWYGMVDMNKELFDEWCKQEETFWQEVMT